MSTFCTGHLALIGAVSLMLSRGLTNVYDLNTAKITQWLMHYFEFMYYVFEHMHNFFKQWNIIQKHAADRTRHLQSTAQQPLKVFFREITF